MWPYIRQSILHTVQTIQHFYESHTRLARNVGIVSILTGTAAGATVFLLIALGTSGSENSDMDFLLTFSLYSGITPATTIAILAGSLVAIHFYKGSLPATGPEFIAGIPNAAWQLFITGALAIVVLFGIQEMLEQTYLSNTLDPDVSPLARKLFRWIVNLLQTTIQITAALFAGMVYLRGIGRTYSPDVRGEYISATVLQFFWIMVLNSLVYLINQLASTPLGFILPADVFIYIMFGAVAFFVFLFGMIPAAAITASIVAPELEIEFEGETEKHL